MLPNAGELSLSVSWAQIDGASDRRSCAFVQDQGDVSAFYRFTEVDGQLTLAQDSAVAPLAGQPLPFTGCPDLDDQERLNARLSWLSPKGDWQVAAWVTNGTDWEPEADAGGLGGDLRSNFSDGSPAYTRREEPRMYGLELTYTFQ